VLGHEPPYPRLHQTPHTHLLPASLLETRSLRVSLLAHDARFDSVGERKFTRP
jgi:hypothetical protein